MYLFISLFGFEGRISDLIVSVPDHCLSFYFTPSGNEFHGAFHLCMCHKLGWPARTVINHGYFGKFYST